MPSSTKGAYDWVRTAVALREPVFTDDERETGEEASEPKGIDRGDRRISEFAGDNWVEYVFQLRVATIQQLVKEQGRLSLTVRF